MTQTMLEKMARAMLRAEIDREPHAWDLPEHEWSIQALEVHGFISNARAALQALREPTEEMITVGARYGMFDETHEPSRQQVRWVISSAIDAILQEKPKPL